MNRGGWARQWIIISLVVTGVALSYGLPERSLPEGPSHRLEHGFRNTNPAFTPPRAWDRVTFVAARVWATTFHPRSVQLPTADPDISLLTSNRSKPTVTWIGHSTLLIQLDGVNLLTDPQWSDRASPVSFAGPKRVMPPGVTFENLPPIDLVLISHDHYDHLDVATVQHLADRDHPLFLVPLGLRAWFLDRGITQVEEVDWWESRTHKGLMLTLVPAQHFSGRTLWDRSKRLWGGWTVVGQGKRFFFVGDTGYYDVFKEIGRRLGPFDLTAVPIGAYLPPTIMRMTHTTPEEALQIFADVQGQRLVPIHWGTFDLTEEPLDEPPARLAAEARRLGLDADHVWHLKHGETRQW